MFFYSESKGREEYTGPSVWSMDGTRGYLRHYDNYLYLSFVFNNPLATMVEKHQAGKELKMCERKLAFWKRHPTYNDKKAIEEVIKKKKQWEIK